MRNMKEKEIFQAAIILLITVFLVKTLIPFYTGSMMPLVVLSGSMTPMMLPGDMIIEKSVDPGELKVGDVIAFYPPGKENTVATKDSTVITKENTLVTHRIISLEEGKERRFQTKGDANNAQDDFKILASNVKGKLIFVIPFAGYLPDTVKKNKNILLFTVILPAGLIIFDEIRAILLYSNPAKARKVEKEQKKIARRTSYVVKGKRLAAFILITGILFTGVVAHNLGENGHVVLQKEQTIKNQGFFSQVYVLTPDDYEQRIAINFWYGVITPDNETRVTVPENTPAIISSVPYILPVFWIISLSEINPYFPVFAEIGFYTFLSMLFLLPLWYRKSIVGRKNKIKFRRLFAEWKRALHLT
ncbi:MAG TPA: signal peptidase I [Methanosarcina sp.]|nr:signal peptidase I [Methanosarcina sp.]